MTCIVHISDTHFGTEVPEVVTAIRHSITQLQPDIVILSGDITQRARNAQFESAAQFLASLPVKTKLVIPGNHDIPLFNIFARFITPYANYRKAFGERAHSWSGDGITILCYDATNPLRHTRGKLTKRALKWGLAPLKKQENTDGFVIACAHQPLVTAWPEDAHETLINREMAAQLWSQHRVDIVLSGHVHVPLITTTAEAFPALPYHFILAGAGTAVSHRTRPGAPNSFNVITTSRATEGAKAGITLHYYDEPYKHFIAAPTVEYTRTSHGWQPIGR